MKQWISLMLVLALALAAVPALAGEGSGAPTAVGDTFQALRTLPAGEQAQLVALNNTQLAAIEGARNMGNGNGGNTGICVVCVNIALALNILSVDSIAETGPQTINLGTGR